MATRRPSKADIRRQRQQLLTEQPLPELDAKVAAYIDNYTPRDIDPAVWVTVRPFVIDTICRYAPTQLESCRQRLTTLSAYSVWALDRGLELTKEALLDVDVIEAYTSSADLGKSAAMNYRSRLRGITKQLHPAGVGAQLVARQAHIAVKPPYSPFEIAAIIKIANTQPSLITGRQLCACVGLGLGAGLDSADLKPLRGRHVIDTGEDGIRIEVPEGRVRIVWVRREFEPMVRAAMQGVTAGQLVVGRKAERRNVAAKVFEQAHILGNAPHFEQSRMRTTWLASLLADGVPLPVIMDAAGLVSARTLTDLIPHLTVAGDVSDQLRGVTR